MWIRRGGHDGAAKAAAQRLHYRMSAHAHCDRIKAPMYPGWYKTAMRHQPSARTGPTGGEGGALRLREGIEEKLQLVDGRGNKDDSFVDRPLLELKNMLNRVTVEWVGAQTPDRLSGVSDKPTSEQALSG